MHSGNGELLMADGPMPSGSGRGYGGRRSLNGLNPSGRENTRRCCRYDDLHDSCVTCDTLYPFSGKSYEKIVQKKDYRNGTQCDTSDTEIIRGNPADRGSKDEQDLPGPVLLKGQSPAIIFFPACNISHIAGGLDPVALPAEDLEIVPGPLVPSHGDRPDVIHDAVMRCSRTLWGAAFRDLLSAVSTFPFLLRKDMQLHLRNSGLPAPVLGGAGGPAADCIQVPEIEVASLMAAVGTGPPGEAFLLFGRVGVPAGFAMDHLCTRISGFGRDNAGAGGGESDWRLGVPPLTSSARRRQVQSQPHAGLERNGADDRAAW